MKNVKRKSKREPRGNSEPDEEKRHERRRKKKTNREAGRINGRERENEDNLEIGHLREGRKKKNNDNNGRIERDMLPVSHATVWYPKQIRETCSGCEENTKSKRRHASFVPRTDLEFASALRPVKKKRNARVNIVRPTTLGLPHKRHLNEHTCGTHEWPISQTPALANPWRIASPAKNDDSRDSKTTFNNIANLLAFLLLQRDGILHR